MNFRFPSRPPNPTFQQNTHPFQANAGPILQGGLNSEMERNNSRFSEIPGTQSTSVSSM